MECRGGEEGWSLVAGAEETLVHLAEERSLENKGKESGLKRRKSRERDVCQRS